MVDLDSARIRYVSHNSKGLEAPRPQRPMNLRWRFGQDGVIGNPPVVARLEPDVDGLER